MRILENERITEWSSTNKIVPRRQRSVRLCCSRRPSLSTGSFILLWWWGGEQDLNVWNVSINPTRFCLKRAFLTTSSEKDCASLITLESIKMYLGAGVSALFVVDDPLWRWRPSLLRAFIRRFRYSTFSYGQSSSSSDISISLPGVWERTKSSCTPQSSVLRPRSLNSEMSAVRNLSVKKKILRK